MAETTQAAPADSGQATTSHPAVADAAPAAAPTIAQGQTTSVAEGGTHALEEQPTEGAQAAEQKAPSLWDNWLLYAVIGLWVWYLFGNKKRRQAKAQEKKDQERRNALQKGDKIITIGRMHGEVVAFTDDTITIKPDGKSDFTMTFDRQAIYKRLPRSGEEEPAK